MITTYTVTLKESQSKRHNLSSIIRLEKAGSAWQAKSWHEKLVEDIKSAIETAR